MQNYGKKNNYCQQLPNQEIILESEKQKGHIMQRRRVEEVKQKRLDDGGEESEGGGW